MTALVLLTSFIVLRALGSLGLRRFASWRGSAAHALALMLVMTASAHFAPGDVTVMPNHDDVHAMVPPVVPVASAVVYLTGVLEILGAVGLVVERTRESAGLCLALLLGSDCRPGAPSRLPGQYPVNPRPSPPPPRRARRPHPGRGAVTLLGG
jgi:hypothetical protein